MERFTFKVRDRFRRVLAEDQIEEVDARTACKAAAMALAMFTFSQAVIPDTSIEVDDIEGRTIARIAIKIEL
ncbi:hypothetical protein [Neorhizobium alkalisoli]|jgi:hypothetical protein|uniref:Uncharacterized protein n=1 Tax=Neorhizobium alkalisoli TaxID=528178 RepID=A0A561Q874_9HYPH|nr:hypothetical protein [Neorhizobium alkalisoli]TWF46553.1 hypothetical protein FHW37_114122 [Neorhizobium alkalisoli]